MAALAVYKSLDSYLLHLEAMIRDVKSSHMSMADFRRRLAALAVCEISDR